MYRYPVKLPVDFYIYFEMSSNNDLSNLKIKRFPSLNLMYFLITDLG